MKTVTIPETEYLQMQQTIDQLQNQLLLLKDKDFLAKLNLAYTLFTTSTSTKESSQVHKPVSLKRGSAKKLITYISDDFTEPLEEFTEANYLYGFGIFKNKSDFSLEKIRKTI